MREAKPNTPNQSFFHPSDDEKVVSDALKENRALEFDPDNADTYGYRCVARHRVGDLTGAIADCQHAANLYLEQGDDREYQYAIGILDKLHDLSTIAA